MKWWKAVERKGAHQFVSVAQHVCAFDGSSDGALRSLKNTSGNGFSCLPVCSLYLLLMSRVLFSSSVFFPTGSVMRNVCFKYSRRQKQRIMWRVMCDELCQGLAEKTNKQEHHRFYFSLIKGAGSLLLWQKILRLSFTWWDRKFVPELTGWWLDWWVSEAPVLHVYWPGQHTGCDCYMFRKNILDVFEGEYSLLEAKF